MTRVVIPKGSPSREKKAIKTIPRMISGIIMGRVERYSMGPAVRLRMRCIPTAPRVPITAAERQERVARRRLFPSASKIAASRNSVPYHRRENPSHTELSRPPLKE